MYIYQYIYIKIEDEILRRYQILHLFCESQQTRLKRM